MFYSNSSYSPFRVNSNVLAGGGTPSFTNTLSTLFDGVDDKTTLTQVTRNGVFTFSFWFKFTGSFNTNTESFVWGCHNNNSSYLGMSTSSIVRLKLNGTLFTIVESGGNNIPQNTWAQFTLIRNSSNSVQLYLNGATFGSAIATGNPLTFSSFGRIINNSFGFKGNIDESALWFSDETSNVSTIYNSGLPSDLSALASAPRNWWRMGDGSTFSTINDNIGSLPMTMLNMSASNFVADVPPSPFTNTLSTLFDGVDDSVSLVSDILLGTTSSVSFWIKRNDTAIAQPLGCVSAWSDFLVRLQTTQISFGRVPFIFNNATTLSTINQTTDWTHLLFVRTGATCNLYVNGVNNDGAKTNANASWINKFRVIGAPGDGSTWAFNGLIDEVSLFTTALSSSDATAIYNGGVPTSLTSYSPLGWWRMGDGSTYPTINDIGSGGSNGTMNNMSASNFVTDVPT